MNTALNITGTFLDEITFDIPSANWGAKEWAAHNLYRRYQEFREGGLA
jgi:hypothetical protein